MKLIISYITFIIEVNMLFQSKINEQKMHCFQLMFNCSTWFLVQNNKNNGFSVHTLKQWLTVNHTFPTSDEVVMFKTSYFFFCKYIFKC